MAEDDIYKLKAPDWCFTGESPGLLPLVVCESCGQRVSGMHELPLVPAEPFKQWIFPVETFPYPEITWREFTQIQNIARPYLSERAELFPGASLGPFSINHLGHAHAVLKDIEVASPGGYLFKISLLDLLRQRGIEILHQPFTLVDRKGCPNEFGLIHVEPFPLRFHSETLKRDRLIPCATCGDVTSETPHIKPSDFFVLERNTRPVGVDFFTMAPNAGAIFLSHRAFVALTAINPLGFSAELVGKWSD